jgi:DNA-binding transcriptional LysR family regulator
MPTRRPLRPVSYRIDPYDLKLFASVADAGSITAGAARMDLSLAAASVRLQQLEHVFGVAMLRRSKRGVTLTDAGRTLLRHAARLEAEIEAMHADMTAHAHGVRATVRVLCNTAAMTEHLPPLIGSFLMAHPGVDVELCELGSQDVLLAMRQERGDLGIVADYVDTEGLVTRDFRKDRLVALFPMEQAPRRSRTVAFAELTGFPFVGLPADSGLSRLLQREALRFGKVLQHRVRVRSFDAVVQLVGDGVGMAVVPERAARRLSTDRTTYRPLRDAWATRQLRVCAISEQRLPPPALDLFRFLASPDTPTF